MYSTTLALVLAYWFLNFALLANADLFVLNPASGSTCHAGQSCTVDWLDDGSKPLVSALGVCTFGLYTGKQQLVQALAPVNVANTHSMTFTPNAAAGPNSGTYYIGIISTSLKDSSGNPYAAFSPFFNLDGMTGSFDAPLAAATSTLPIPASLSKSSSVAQTGTLTVTVGVLSTSLPSLSPPTATLPVPSAQPSSSSSKMTTSTLPSASPTGSGTKPAPTPTHSSNGASRPASFGGLAVVPLILAPLLFSFF